jgi:hypothetical protein
MLRIRHLATIAGLAAIALSPSPGSAQLTESLVRTHADYEDDLRFDEDCSPLNTFDPNEEGCGCDFFVPEPADRYCDDGGRLFERVIAADAPASSTANACEADACGVGASAIDALALARSGYGTNFVDVFSNSFLTDAENPPLRFDQASAVSRWSDDLTLTTAVPDLADAVLRATFRVRGGWQNAPCLTVTAQLQRLTETPPFAADIYIATSQTTAWDTVCVGALGGGGELPGYDLLDSTLDHVFTLELPLSFPSPPVRIFAELRAHAEHGDDVLLFGPEGGFIGERTEGGGVELRLERLEVPLGVEISSAAGALEAYNVPEPGAALGSLVALGALLASRRR